MKITQIAAHLTFGLYTFDVSQGCLTSSNVHPSVERPLLRKSDCDSDPLMMMQQQQQQAAASSGGGGGGVGKKKKTFPRIVTGYWLLTVVSERAVGALTVF